MENYEQARKFQHDSHVITTLNRQIEALTPLRFSYDNLVQYHQKITVDLASLIDQHDFAISSLKSNIQNLCTIGIRTEAEKNDLTVSVRELQNELAKMVLDTRNMAQKYEALSQKLKLETNRTDQNLAYENELTSIDQTLQSHIANITSMIKQLEDQQSQISSELLSVKQNICEQQKTRATLLSHSEDLKSSIAKMNVKNDDMIDGNRKLSEEIRVKEELTIEITKRNRQLKQKLIEQNALNEKLKNQIDYKTTLLTSQAKAQNELSLHLSKLQIIVSDLQSEKSLIGKENQILESEIAKMQSQRQQDLSFKNNCQKHLTELKQTNELLMTKMEHFCVQDQHVHTLMLRKMASLEYFSKKLNQKYEFEQSSRLETVLKESLLLKERGLNFNELKSVQQKIPKVELKKSDSKKETSSSDKSWLVKENYS